MKKASGTIRIDLAQYREMEVFTQFSSDLDDTTKEQLQYGKGLMELLKQPLCHPMSLADQVITLVAANKRLLLDVETAKTKEFQLGMLDFFHDQSSCLPRTNDHDIPNSLSVITGNRPSEEPYCAI